MFFAESIKFSLLLSSLVIKVVFWVPFHSNGSRCVAFKPFFVALGLDVVSDKFWHVALVVFVASLVDVDSWTVFEMLGQFLYVSMTRLAGFVFALGGPLTH